MFWGPDQEILVISTLLGPDGQSWRRSWRKKNQGNVANPKQSQDKSGLPSSRTWRKSCRPACQDELPRSWMQGASTVNIECSCNTDFTSSKSCQQWETLIILRIHYIYIEETSSKGISKGLSSQHSDTTNLCQSQKLMTSTVDSNSFGGFFHGTFPALQK